MRYAILNGRRIEASKEIKDTFCECCNQAVNPYCGKIQVHHFRHKSKIDCDNWYEPITEWHLAWQNQFSENFREVVLTRNDCKHRADIINSKDVVVEFQNSLISIEEIRNREEFYEKMVWVFNGIRFKDRFILDKDLTNYCWLYPQKPIFSCKKPVFIDIGTDYLFWINFQSFEMPRFRMKKREDWKYFNAVRGLCSRGMGWSNSYYACYPIKPIQKNKFILHYNV